MHFIKILKTIAFIIIAMPVLSRAMQPFKDDNHLAIARHLPSNKKGLVNCNKNLLLRSAVKDSLFDSVVLLLESGGDVNCQGEIDGESLLHLGVMHSKETFQPRRMVELLLYSGANPDLTNKCGETPLHLATLYNKLESIFLLLNYRANVNCAIKSNGYTPLHIAAREDNTNVIITLLKAGADANARGVHGITPLHLAAQKGSSNSIATLLDHGARIDALYMNTCTPLDLAVKTQSITAIPLLLSRGAAVCKLLQMHENRICILDAEIVKQLKGYKISRITKIFNLLNYENMATGGIIPPPATTLPHPILQLLARYL